jgi:hypothetical protein
MASSFGNDPRFFSSIRMENQNLAPSVSEAHMEDILDPLHGNSYGLICYLKL